MSISSLIVDSEKIDEEVIEGLIKEFVRFDPKKSKMVFTPAFTKLSAKQKVVVCLAGVEGWKFIEDTNQERATSPSDLENQTGIKGGTLRPILKELAENKLIRKDGKNYHLETANISQAHEVVYPIVQA